MVMAGRPRTEYPDNLAGIVMRLAGIGCTISEIEAVTDIKIETLERHYGELLKKGRETGKACLRRFQWQNAASGNPTMQIWLGKQLLGQSDKAELNVIQEIKFGDFEQLPELAAVNQSERETTRVH